MKNLLPRGLSMIIAVSFAFSSCPTITASASEPKITKELFDYRNLDEKFTNRNEDFIFDLKKDIEENGEVFHVTAKDLRKKPGSIIKASDDYVISIPEIRENGEITDRLGGYGILEVFSYGYSEGLYEDWSGESTLVLFDKSLVSQYPITVSNFTINGGPYVYSNLPLLEMHYVSKRYDTAEEAKARVNFDTRWSYGWYVEAHWQDDQVSGIKFGKTSLNFSSRELSRLIRRTEQCSLLSRDSIKSLYHGEKFDIQGLFNDFSGSLAGKFRIRGGYNGFCYIYPTDNPAAVIAINENKIYVGISARYPWEDVKSDVDNDVIYTALVYEDKSKNPKEISLGGYQTVTRDTLDELLHLLMDPEIIWSNINVLDL